MSDKPPVDQSDDQASLKPTIDPVTGRIHVPRLPVGPAFDASLLIPREHIPLFKDPNAPSPEEIDALLADPEKLHAWMTRPPDPEELDDMSFFG